MRALAHRPEPLARASSNGSSANGSSCICLLDDDLSMLRALERLLKCEGLKAKKFTDPTVFLGSINETRCPVAILDVWMPDMNGLEVQEELRKASPQTRIIFMSGRDDPAVRQTALEAGAFGFLAKPFDDETLVQMVHEALAA
ncbi:MAG TPA: response regulator [Chthoniobacterales bacterium]|nr:response regulator [Chthoniobacterales bacterium]